VPAQAATNGKKMNAIQDLDMTNPSASDRGFQQQGRRWARIVSTKGGWGLGGRNAYRGLRRNRYSHRMADQSTSGEYRSGHDPRTLRDALGCFATGVTVVTCLSPNGAPAGLTVNSFNSVSLDPPLLLVCLDKKALSAKPLIEASHFAVNVLQTGQQPASIRFSTRDEDRFGSTPWACGEAGAPILEESLGVFECERFALQDGGDHHILIGRVVKASFDSGLDPLLYFRGRYRRLHFD
jgi:flavin reductase (DIM6/NTAB) family NADH-FMN oxidoreductase RutF